MMNKDTYNSIIVKKSEVDAIMTALESAQPTCRPAYDLLRVALMIETPWVIDGDINPRQTLKENDG